MLFNFTNNKNFSWPIFSVSFSKNIFVFWNPNTMTNFEFRFGYIRIFVVFSLRIRCYVNWFHFYCSTNCVIVFIDNIYWQYWQYRQIHQNKTFFEIAVMCLKSLFFSVLINLSATTDFPSLCVEYISMLFIFKNFLKSCKIHPLDQPIFHLVFFLLRLFFEMH